jgi:hypothetical protein
MTTRISIISEDDDEPGATALGNVVGGSVVQSGPGRQLALWTVVDGSLIQASDDDDADAR